MGRIKLTERAVAGLPAPDPQGRQRLYWDQDLVGFGVLCSGKTAAKTYVVQRDLPGGRTRRVTIARTNVVNLDEARQQAKGKLADFYRGIDPKAARRSSATTTLRATLDEYLKARNDLRPKSRSEYRKTIERYLGAWLDRPLREITPEMVEQRHRAIQAEVEAGDQTGKRNGHASANAAMRALRVLWNFAAERVPELPSNPVARLRRQWFSVKKRERCVRAEDLPKFYKAVRSLPNEVARDYLTLLLFTGLRRSEAAGLTWDDVDFVQNVIRVPASYTKADRKLDLPMSDFVRDLLKARQKIEKGRFVFPASGDAGHISEPKFPLDLVHGATGIQVSAHDLRRTFVTVAESADISPLALKALVNHSLGGDITAGYVVMTVERLREPAQRVCDRLKALCKIRERPRKRKRA